MGNTPVPSVVFTGGDYKPVRLASGLIGFRAPFEFTVPPGKTAPVDLQSSCSVALLVNDKVVEPGTNIVVHVHNGDQLPAKYDVGEVFARAVPLLLSNYKIG